jgi:nucleotide-binding universal stress UspA family protein
MKVLLAIDGSECSDVAVNEVASRPWPAVSEFKILTAYELPLMPTPEAWAISADYCDRLSDAVREQALTTSEAARTKLTGAFGGKFSVTSEILAGSPKAVILERAESWDADLIVMGSHGYRAWERFLLGSVSQAVVSHAKCSVEVVRCKYAEAHKTEAA